MRRRKVIIFAVVVFAMYASGYVLSRVSGQIVHYAGYRTDSGSRVVAEHRVDVGGQRDVVAPPQNPILAMIYTPVRWVETLAWYIVDPPGSAWSGS